MKNETEKQHSLKFPEFLRLDDIKKREELFLGEPKKEAFGREGKFNRSYHAVILNQYVTDWQM